MIIQAKARGFICLNAHPSGCKLSVERQAKYALSHAKELPFKNALIIGASTGYGLASRIALGIGANVPTLGVFLERAPQEGRTASAGWYNTAAFADLAQERNLYAKSVCGDAFSKATKESVAELIKNDFGKLDLLIYSVAAPKRTVESGETFSSVIKPVGKAFEGNTIDIKTETLRAASLLPASEEEIASTVKVMGGEDWEDWISFLKDKNLLSKDFTTVAYSYIGPEMTFPVYRDGTIGAAKKHLETTAEHMRSSGVEARIAENKAVVTQAGAAIPVVPLYMSALMRVMKDKGLHEGCIEQMCRLLFTQWGKFDEEGRMRVDDLELRADVQADVKKIWQKLTDENLHELTDIKGYKEEFMNGFGFDYPEIDYDKDVEYMIDIKDLIVV